MSSSANGKRYARAWERSQLDPDHAHLLEWINQFQRVRKYGPALHEIAAGLGWKRARVGLAIGRLVRDGWLVRPEGIARALRPATEDERQDMRRARWDETMRQLPAEEIRAACEAGARRLAALAD